MAHNGDHESTAVDPGDSDHDWTHRSAFMSWLRREQRESALPLESGSQKKVFVPEARLREYFSVRDSTEELLEELSPKLGFTIPFDQIGNHLKIFATLLTINHGKHIFHCHDKPALRDSRFPFDHLPQDFPGGVPFEEYKKQQWQFCAPHIESGCWQYDTEETVLPITKVEKLKPAIGTSSKVFMMKIHPEYNRLKWRDIPVRQDELLVLKISGTRRTDLSQAKKELRAITHFRNAFKSDLSSIVRHYGSFAYHGRLYSIQEYANGGSLEELFRGEKLQHPSDDQHAAEFWKNLLQIVNGVSTIHHHASECRVEGRRILVGWHQDITPRNILVFNFDPRAPWRSTFKLADFGLSLFEPKPKAGTESDERVPRPTFLGTQNYNPPRRAESPNPNPSSSDVWALGCVFSEFAVWIEREYDGLHKYRWDRRRESSKDSEDDDRSWDFHVHGKTLQCVQEIHTNLERSARFDCTKIVIPHFIDFMLTPSSKSRPSIHFWQGRAPNLITALDAIISGQPSLMHTREPHHSEKGEEKPGPSKVTDDRTRKKPLWTVEAAQVWLKGYKSQAETPCPLDWRVRQLQGRDHVLLIDDSPSMHEHWSQVQKCVKLLLKLLFTIRADDKIDYWFTNRVDKHQTTSKGLADAFETIRNRMPVVPREESLSDLLQCDPGVGLSTILKKHVKRTNYKPAKAMLSNLISPFKPISLYVLTDGKWPNKKKSEDAIKDAVTKCKNLRKDGADSTLSIGVQFVTFGNDEQGLKNCAYLDKAENLGLETDIVDTEPWDSDFAKLLIGPLDPNIDRRNDSELKNTGGGHDMDKERDAAFSNEEHSD